MLLWCKAQEIIWRQDWPWFVLWNVCWNNFKTLTLNPFTMPSVAFRKQLTDLEVDKENWGNKATALYHKSPIFLPLLLSNLFISVSANGFFNAGFLQIHKANLRCLTCDWELGLLTPEWGVGRSEDVNSLSLHWGCEAQLPSLHVFLQTSSSTDARWNGNMALTDTRGWLCRSCAITSCKNHKVAEEKLSRKELASNLGSVL